MITNGIIDLVMAVLNPLLSALPTIDLSGLVSALTGSTAGEVGAYLGPLNTFLPITNMLQVAAIVAVLLPVILGYEAFNWVWRHIPEIAGFGTGAG